mgnify:CR=1 FL=1
MSASHFITKDPETGIQNMGNYRGQIKAPDRTGIYMGGAGDQHISRHWRLCRERGIPLYRTDHQGTLTFASAGDPWQVQCFSGVGH